MCCLYKSYRTSREAELIRHGADVAIIRAQVEKLAVDLTVQVSHTEKKRLLVNQKSTTANSLWGA